MTDFKAHNSRFSPFSDFVKLMVKESEVASNPVTSIQRVSLKSKSQDSQGKGKGKGTVLNTSSNKKTPVCYYCEKGHCIDKCKGFAEKSIGDRWSFVKSKRLFWLSIKKAYG